MSLSLESLEIIATHIKSCRSESWDTGWRILPFVLLEIPYFGAWRCEIEGGDSLEVNEGQILVLPVGCRHRLVNRPTPQMTSSWAYLTGIALKMVALPKVIQAQSFPVDDFFQDQKGLIGNLRRQRSAYQFLEVALDNEIQHDDIKDSRIEKCMQWCRQNIHQHIDRDDMARIAGLSPTRFHEVFSRCCGQAPKRWLAETRLKLAQKALLRTDATIGNISEKCGYASPFYFSRTFHKACGQTPLSYRRLHRG